MSHSRKKLYKILFDYIKCNEMLEDELFNSMRYDYVFNNQFEDLPDYLNRNAEEKYKALKRYLSNEASFISKYFGESRKNEKIANEFRIVDINDKPTLFIYKDKENIFNRCSTYILNDLIGEINYEQKI